MRSNPTVIFVILIVAILGLGGFSILNQNKIPTPDREEIPEENQSGLEEDRSSINTIIYGKRSASETRIYAVNDSGKNNTIITTIKPDIKFITPLIDGRRLLYISDTDEGDIGASFTLKTINSTDDGERVIYESSDSYGIDRYVISSNNEWIAWYEVSPEGSAYTHSSDYFRVYKANLGEVLSGDEDVLEPRLLSEIKGAPGVLLNIPTMVMDNGEVLFDALIPHDYSLYYGFKNEEGEDILPLNTYNSTPYLFDGNNLLYTSFNPEKKVLDPREGTSTRVEILNTNTVKTTNINTRQTTTVGLGDEGEQYKHTIFVEGNSSDKLSFLSDIYQVIDEGGERKLTPYQIQLITKDDTEYKKDVILDTNDGKKYRILSVGDKPSGEKTVLVAEETFLRGNLGTGLGVGPSGYKNQIKNIKVINLDSKEEKIIESFASSEFEFIAVVLKSPDEKIGLDRDKKLAEELAANQQQLQIENFVPIEPRRERSNPRSDCEKEWQEKGYPNYEACEACPIYIYSSEERDVSVSPITPISVSSAIPEIKGDKWSFKTGNNGDLHFEDGVYKKIDYDFPRGSISPPKWGVLLDRTELEKGISDYAYALGFKTREVDDIVDFYMEELKDASAVYFSHLPSHEVEKLLSVKVTPEPESYASYIFYARKLTTTDNVSPQPPNFEPFVRKDFSVVVWGSVIE